MKILFITPYPQGQAPSQRFRFEQYFDQLQAADHQYKVHSFFTTVGWQKLYHAGVGTRIYYTLWGFLRRLAMAPFLGRYHMIFIHREATPLGPPWFEWLVCKIWRKRMVYDFDDAIWLEDPDESGTFLAKLKWKKKVATLCRWSYKVSAGNAYLAEYARGAGGTQVVINPTTLDMDHHHVGSKEQSDGPITLGWTGTHSTLQYLNPIIPVLNQLAENHSFRFLVISNQKPDWELPFMVYQAWNKETEIADLLQMHVGVMPLTDDPWSLGKCGFKALQYLSLGIPAVVSPVGVNREIVVPGQHGFWATTHAEWYRHLENLILDSSLRDILGKEGKEHVRLNFSVSSNAHNFLNLFEIPRHE